MQSRPRCTGSPRVSRPAPGRCLPSCGPLQFSFRQPLGSSPNQTFHLAFTSNRAMNGVAMSTFTIDTDNNIQAYAEAPASSNPAEVFSTQKELAKLAVAWPAARLIEIWNSFAGGAPFDDLKPVRKFTSRKGAVTRIWKAIERLSPDVAQPAEPVAPSKGRAKKSPTKAKRRDTARPGAKRAANVAREGSKKAEILDLMRR